MFFTKEQYKLLKEESKRTGNSQSSIVRTALDRYFKSDRYENSQK